MTTLHPQYITDTAGQKLVVLPIDEFKLIMEELEDMDDVRAYDEAKKEDDGERMLFSDYIKQRREKNA